MYGITMLMIADSDKDNKVTPQDIDDISSYAKTLLPTVFGTYSNFTYDFMLRVIADKNVDFVSDDWAYLIDSLY